MVRMRPRANPAFAGLLALAGGALLAPLPAGAAEALIAVDVPVAGCPGRAEVIAALESRLPGVTRGRGGAGPARYRLEISHAPGEPEAPLQLRSLAGGVVLERRLPVQANARPAEVCQALAEAAGLVVVRYLRELGYRPAPEPPPQDEPRAEPASAPAPAVPERSAAAAPAPAPSTSAGSPSRPADAVTVTTPAPGAATRVAPAARPLASAGYLGAGAIVRMGLRSDPAEVTRGELGVSLQASGRAWHAELGGGVSTASRIDIAGSPGELRLRAFPLRAAFGIPVGVGAGQLVPLAGVTVELTSFEATGLADARSGLRAEPSIELGLGYRRAGPSWFWRVQAGGGFSLAPRDFAAEGQAPAHRAPAAYLRALVEVGPVLWKN
jgi:hypothetical protein